MKTSTVLQKIEALAKEKKRLMIGIAGPPGAGKSTLAEKIDQRLKKQGFRSKIVAMDGFHLDNTELDAMGLRAKKGAPETFDAEGFVQLIKLLRKGDQPLEIPGFDRVKDQVVSAIDTVEKEDSILLVEGNYLLLRSKPWCELADSLDLKIFINPGMAELRKRLIQRWLDNDHSWQQAEARANSNDIPNAETVVSGSIDADFILKK